MLYYKKTLPPPTQTCQQFCKVPAEGQSGNLLWISICWVSNNKKGLLQEPCHSGVSISMCFSSARPQFECWLCQQRHLGQITEPVLIPLFEKSGWYETQINNLQNKKVARYYYKKHLAKISTN